MVVSARGRASELASVTSREREVLALLAAGLTNREIAARLVVSEHTVHRHVTNILRKLRLPSRTAAAAHAVRHGLLEPPAAAEDHRSWRRRRPVARVRCEHLDQPGGPR